MNDLANSNASRKALESRGPEAVSPDGNDGAACPADTASKEGLSNPLTDRGEVSVAILDPQSVEVFFLNADIRALQSKLHIQRTVGVWLPMGAADKAKIYDLAITDGKGWRSRVTCCFWRKGGKHGKAGWYSASPELEGDGPAPVLFMDGIRITHCMEVPEIPT